jgi:hypothetical protein
MSRLARLQQQPQQVLPSMPLLQQGRTGAYTAQGASAGSHGGHTGHYQTQEQQLDLLGSSGEQADASLQEIEGGPFSDEGVVEGTQQQQQEPGRRLSTTLLKEQLECSSAGTAASHSLGAAAGSIDTVGTDPASGGAAAPLPPLEDHEQLVAHLVSAAGELWPSFGAVEVTSFLWSAAKLKVYVPGHEEQQQGNEQHQQQQQQQVGSHGVGFMDIACNQHGPEQREREDRKLGFGRDSDKGNILTRETVLQTLAAAVMWHDGGFFEQDDGVLRRGQQHQNKQPWGAGWQQQKEDNEEELQQLTKAQKDPEWGENLQNAEGYGQQHHTQDGKPREHSRDANGSTSSSSRSSTPFVRLRCHQLITCCWAVAQVCTPPPPMDWVSDRLDQLLPSLLNSNISTTTPDSSRSSSIDHGKWYGSSVVTSSGGSTAIVTPSSSSREGSSMSSRTGDTSGTRGGSINQVSPHALSMLLWALAQFGYTPSQYQAEVLVRASLNCMAQFSTQGLATVAWALTKMGVKLDRGWLEVWGEAMGKQMGGANGYELTIGVWVLVKHGVKPAPEWLLLLLQRVLVLLQQGYHGHASSSSSIRGMHKGSRKSGMEALELTRLWWCLSKLGFKPPAPITGTLLAAVAQRQQQLSPQGFALVVLAVARLELKPGVNWLKAMVSCAFDLLPLFTFQEAGALLLGLAKLGHLPSEAWMEGWWWVSWEQMQQMDVANPQVGGDEENLHSLSRLRSMTSRRLGWSRSS